MSLVNLHLCEELSLDKSAFKINRRYQDCALFNIKMMGLILLAILGMASAQRGPAEYLPPTVIPETVTVTETAVAQTSYVSQPVTLTKTQTRDEYITITNPVYNSIAATVTNIEKATVSVPEEQVIRSPVAGGWVVNTIPVPKQTVLTVTGLTTNYFVLTVSETVSDRHDHTVTDYVISTVTANNLQTSTVVQTISRTSVSRVLRTSTVNSTVYRTTTIVISLGGGTETTTSGQYNY